MSAHQLAAVLGDTAVVVGQIAFGVFIGLLIAELVSALTAHLRGWPKGWAGVILDFAIISVVAALVVVVL